MKKLTPNQIWIGLFGIWSLLLTGIFSNTLGALVGPGALQSIRLQNLLQSKIIEMEEIQNHVNELQAESELIEKNPITQQREIRRLLGYTAQDELVFDFNVSGAI